MSLITINNTTLREHTVKILQLLINASKEFQEIFKQKQGYSILSMIIRECKSKSSMSLCQTVLNAILSEYDNPIDLKQLGHTLVQQVMNKSQIGREIVKQSNVALNKPKKRILIYY
jgi:YesN/AraC family two-component response regulator